MLELEDAKARILAAIPPPRPEIIPLAEASGRIASKRIAAPVALPVFDNSSMDGYAVLAADLASASADKPVRLHLIGRAAAGEVFQHQLNSGSCVRIFTGSPLPQGADAVVMQEDTRVDNKQPNEVLVLDSVKPWENVRFRGEDIKLGGAIIEPGDSLHAGKIALLAAVGQSKFDVARRPRVGLIATGSELKMPGDALGPGQIYESNRAALAALLQSTCAITNPFPIVPDAPNATVSTLKHAFDTCDCVITCGGVSVGEMDFVKSAFEKLGGELQFWKVAIKPGRPFVFGKLDNRLLFGLPGNPVSAFVTFLLLVRPALLRWQGANGIEIPSHPSVLAEPLINSGGRRHFMRVKVDEAGTARSAGFQASHALSSLAHANGLVDVPPETTLAAGTTANVMRWDLSV